MKNNDLIVKHINGTIWKVVKKLTYITSLFDIIEVPENFITDFASIPRIFWTIFGHPAGEYAPAAVIHDYLYYTQIYTRKKSDQIFLEAMKYYGVAAWKRIIMYRAVRWFSWIGWKMYKRENEKNA